MSNLLDKASIILTPTAYNNGEALCVKPSDGSGDFDFSRNSAATRVNAQGLVENVQILSSNLVQNGDFSEEGTEEVSNGSFTNGSTDWVLGTGWSIGEDEAVCDGSQTSVSFLTQNGQVQSGKTYKVTYNVTSYTSGEIIAFIGGSQGQTRTSVGTYTEYLTTSNTNFWLRANADFIGSITNISVKEVGQNWTLGNWSVGDSLVLSGATSLLQQPTIYTNATGIYKTTFKAKSVNGTSVTLRLYDGSTNYETFTITSSNFQDFELTRQRAGADSGLYFYNNSNAEIEITNISVIEITDDTNLPRINYEGFSYQDALGSEQIVNGDFSSPSDWGLAGGSPPTITNNKLNLIGDTYNSIASNVGASLVSGKTYKVSFEITDYTSGGATFRLGGVFGVSKNGLGVHTQYIVSDGAAIRLYSSENGTDLSLTNVSVKEYLGQEVVPDSGCGSWLFEPQSTNLITQSELFSDASWLRVGSITTTDNYTTSPSGQNNGTRLQWTNATNYIYQSLSHVGSDFTLSIYLKSNTNVSQNVRLFMDNGAQAKDVVVTTQWQRFELTNTTTPTQSNRNTGLIRSSSQVGDLDISIWGAQFEAQSYPTSLIPTEGSTNTRNQDVCTNGGSLASINSTEGTLYAEIAALSNDGTSRYISISDGTSSNAIKIYYFLSGNFVFFQKLVNGVRTTNIIANYVIKTDFNKIAIRYNSTEISVFLNGVNIINNADTNVFAPNTLNTLQFTDANGADKFFGKTKALAVFPYLSDQELTELTTL